MKIVIGILIPATIVFGNLFCGWVCPFGALQEVTAKFGSLFLKKKLKIPRHMQKYLQLSKLVIACVSLMPIAEMIIVPIDGQRNFIMMSTLPFALTVNTVIILSYLIISIFFDRFYCNYLCIESIKFTILNSLRIFTIKRDSDKCINCKKCSKVCPMQIDVSQGNYVKNLQCINCFQCISECPKSGALTYSSRLKDIKIRILK